jgi:hypothetical protein
MPQVPQNNSEKTSEVDMLTKQKINSKYDHLKTRSPALPGVVYREVAALLPTLFLDELDTHQRALCEESYAKPDHHIFHSPNNLEEVPYSKLKRRVGISAVMSESHPER